MPKTYGFIRNLIIALILFALGRLIVVQFGENIGTTVIIVTVVFYGVWYVNYRRQKIKEKRGDK